MRMSSLLVAGLVAGCGSAVPPIPAIGAHPPPAELTATAAPESPLPRMAPIAVAEGTPASAPAPATPAMPALAWTSIFAAYFGPGSPGGCGRAGRCHAAEMHGAASAYEWLSRRGYIDGTRSAITSRTNSCLRWFGGNMPPVPQPSADAERDLEAWVATGARSD